MKDVLHKESDYSGGRNGKPNESRDKEDSETADSGKWHVNH